MPHSLSPTLISLVGSPRGIKGTRQIGVILYAKRRPQGPAVSADELPIEDVLSVQDHVVPFDGADVFEQGQIHSVADRVAQA